LFHIVLSCLRLA